LPFLSNGAESLYFARLFTNGYNVYSGGDGGERVFGGLAERKLDKLIGEMYYGADIHMEHYSMKR